MQVKKGMTFKVPVQLLDPNGTPVTGRTYSGVTCYIQKQGGASTAKTLSSGADFAEIDATHMPGVYDLLLSVSNTDTIGFLKYGITASGVNPFIGIVEIVGGIGQRHDRSMED